MCTLRSRRQARRAVIGAQALFLCISAGVMSAQKVKTGFDKSAVFPEYKTYTWAEAEHEPSRPVLAELVVAFVDTELESKGLKRIDKGGDLLLIPAGGFSQEFGVIYGLPIVSTGSPTIMVNAGAWSGPLLTTATGISPTVHEGSLVIALQDQKRSRVIWEGSVTEKLDPEHKQESLSRVQKAIAKLFKDFPPRKR
jgi:Domain of unknown function (DUF4136)